MEGALSRVQARNNHVSYRSAHFCVMSFGSSPSDLSLTLAAATSDGFGGCPSSLASHTRSSIVCIQRRVLHGYLFGCGSIDAITCLPHYVCLIMSASLCSHNPTWGSVSSTPVLIN